MPTEDQTIIIRIPLDGETAARLRNLSNICHADPVSVAASLLHDVLKEDADAHFLLSAPSGSSAIN